MPGLDSNSIDILNFDLAIGRTRTDVLTDFVIAPHYSAIYTHTKDELIEIVKRQLKSGQYSPCLPVKAEVPKSNGLSRPGCILNPVDRMVYQIVVDSISIIAESQMDRTLVFSNVLLTPDPEFRMFQSQETGWQNMQNEILRKASDTDWHCVIKSDIANYFACIYQHNLINLLRSSGCDTPFVNLLEQVLSSFTSRNSHGIIQGLYPSDFLGNFYLVGVDDYFRIRGVPYLRFVDDMYLFFKNEFDAKKGMIDLCQIVRREGLSLNDSKTAIMTTDSLIREETEIDRLIERAKQEIRETPLAVETETIYGFLTEWVMGEQILAPVEIELQAVEYLYTAGLENRLKSDRIEKFSLPYLARVGNRIAIQNCLNRIELLPHLSKLYSNYLSHFIKGDDTISQGIQSIVCRNSIPYDWSLIWPITVLLESNSISGDTIDRAIQLLQDPSKLDALRCAAVALVAKYGAAGQRRILRHTYEMEHSVFVKESILYATRYFPSDERNACFRAWGNHSLINSLIVKSIRAHPAI